MKQRITQAVFVSKLIAKNGIFSIIIKWFIINNCAIKVSHLKITLD